MVICLYFILYTVPPHFLDLENFRCSNVSNSFKQLRILSIALSPQTWARCYWAVSQTSTLFWGENKPAWGMRKCEKNPFQTQYWRYLPQEWVSREMSMLPRNILLPGKACRARSERCSAGPGESRGKAARPGPWGSPWVPPPTASCSA